MELNIVVNDNGVRRVRWFGVAVIFTLCMSIPLGPWLMLRAGVGLDWINIMAVGMGLSLGLFLFILIVGRRLRMPLEQLPRSTGR